MHSDSTPGIVSAGNDSNEHSHRPNLTTLKRSPQDPVDFPLPGSEVLPTAFRELGPRELLINEFFLSIQGESSHAGRPCFFIRLTGCHLRCNYCDTEYAFHEGFKTTIEDCLQRAEDAACSLVEVTGGEPLLQKSVLPLMAELCDRGFEVLLETSGSVNLRRVDARVRKIVDVKTPSCGMDRYNVKKLEDQLTTGDEIKIVIGDRRDYDWTCDWIAEHDGLVERGLPIFLSPVHGQLSPEELSRWILEDGVPVRLNLQLHKYIWPETLRGV